MENILCSCGNELHEVYFGDQKTYYRCIKCDSIYNQQDIFALSLNSPFVDMESIIIDKSKLQSAYHLSIDLKEFIIQNREEIPKSIFNQLSSKINNITNTIQGG